MQTYMQGLLSGTTVTGADATKTYTGDDHVVGKVTSGVVTPVTLGTTDNSATTTARARTTWPRGSRRRATRATPRPRGTERSSTTRASPSRAATTTTCRASSATTRRTTSPRSRARTATSTSKATWRASTTACPATRTSAAPAWAATRTAGAERGVHRPSGIALESRAQSHALKRGLRSEARVCENFAQRWEIRHTRGVDEACGL